MEGSRRRGKGPGGARKMQLLTKTEREQILHQSSSIGPTLDHKAVIQGNFESLVRRTPDAIAVIEDRQVLTYAELNAKANQFAHVLLAQGVKPDERVGLYADRSMEAVVGLLGVLKAGAAYVPLDPTYPWTRVNFIAKDSSLKFILAQPALVKRLSEFKGSIITLDAPMNECAENPVTHTASKNLAYVIYTSGSTGRPKGVMVEHRSVLRLVCNTNYAQLDHRDCVAHCATQSFDAATWEVWAPLLNGARMAVIPQSVVLDSARLNEALLGHSVTAMWLTVGLFNEYIDSLEAAFANLKYLIVGGDALNPAIVARALSKAKRPKFLMNGYGPTETTTFATTFSIASDFTSGQSVPIGRPIANTSAYVLDGRLELLPVGMAGGIYIGGPGVARGYIDKPDVTAERFVADPFCPIPGGRLYRTGDIGRWRSDGQIDYLGRTDFQVKIRGYRVEPGEVEAALQSHPGVKRAVVLPYDDVRGKRLIAYVIPNVAYLGEMDVHRAGASKAEFVFEPPSQDESASADVATILKQRLTIELREYVEGKMPSFMVPSAIMSIDSIPLTPNGKVDRNALPVPETIATTDEEFEEPQGQTEEIVARIWQDILCVAHVSRRDNFFALGGHSLLIVRLMDRLRRSGLSTTMRNIYENSSLADLARTLTHEVKEQYEVPPNQIPPGCQIIDASMLPLVPLSQKEIERIVNAVPGGAENVQDIYPLAPLQEGILFHHLLSESNGDPYVLPLLIVVPCRHSVDRFIDALQAVIDRHDALRTAVMCGEVSKPVQIVFRRARLQVEQISLDTERDPVEQLKQRMTPAGLRMNLERAPMVRLQIAPDAVGKNWYALLWLHLLACDHESVEIMFSELIYHMRGEARMLPEPLAYRNHIARVLQGARGRDAEAFFVKKLGNIDSSTAPFGVMNVHGSGNEVSDSHEDLELTLARRVRSQSRRLGVSAAMLFHAAWALVVSRTSGRDDVVFGTVLLGRTQGADAQGILGMLINTLPVRLRIGDLTISELIEETQQELAELLSYEHVSLALAQRCSAVGGSVPLFTSLFNYRHSVHKLVTDTDEFRLVAGAGWTNYPIIASVDDLGDEFAIAVQSDWSIDARRLTGYLSTAIESVVSALEAAPKIPAVALSVIPELERRELLEYFNAAAVSGCEEQFVHQLFEERVDRLPGALAVVHDQESITYSELNARADLLACQLRAKDVGPEQLVGVLLERGIDMIVVMLGILKAGGACVPLDLSYPNQRLMHVLREVEPRVVVTQDAGRLRLALPNQLIIERGAERWPGPAPSGGGRSVTQSALVQTNLAYVIYTSGSTGRPKGVAMTHRSLRHLIHWHGKSLPCGEGQRVLQFSPPDFDVAFQEIFSTLCTGGTLVLVNECVRRDGAALMNAIIQKKVHRAFLPPNALQALAEHSVSVNAVPSTLGDVVAIGDRLRISDEVTHFLKRLPGCRLHNHYGPTETHVATTLTLREDPELWPTLPSIGSPIAQTKVYVLDRHLDIVPVSVVGEIYIGGAGVARGYLKQPEMTAERFVADCLSGEAGARMYRTGDLGRFLADGTLEYLGRNDDQVKIRGFRIELGEIEARLMAHALVKDSAAIVRENPSGAVTLVAYLVLRETGDADVTSMLRVHLMDTLPDYMVPRQFVLLDAIPRTLSGKVDRQALPLPEGRAGVKDEFELPQGDVEIAVATAWQQLLRIPSIGRNDNFFDLGGDSLLAMRFTSRVHGLAVAMVFRNPRVRQLASVLENGHFDYYHLLNSDDVEEGVL